jgi:hypothetical protein
MHLERNPMSARQDQTGTTRRYGARPVKRLRRTNAQIDALDEAVLIAVAEQAPVTLRGVFYRVVSAGAIEKSEAGYKAIGRRLLALRRNRVVPYSAITDGTRWIRKPTTWSDLDAMLRDASESYRRAFWHDQAVEVEIFSEKDAITGVIDEITEEFDVPLGVLRGYASESFVYRVAAYIEAVDKDVFVYHLGDRDPSGVGAWQDFASKVLDFLAARAVNTSAGNVIAGAFGRNDRTVTFERLAVTADQIREYGLPTRPTKTSDPRAAGFRGGSVEVDAIPATVLRGLVRSAIERHVDQRQLTLIRAVEQQERELLTAMREQL